jgi:hypothetical protein
MKHFLLPALALLLSINAHAVQFPGPQPGPAQAKHSGAVYTLSNNLLSASWRVQNGKLQLSSVSNKLSAQEPLVGAREPFRLSTLPVPPSTVRDGFYLAWRLGDKNVTALYGDGKNWRVLKSFSRAEFAGAPEILRAGKMNLKAQAVDYGDAGAMGKTRLEEFVPKSLAAPEIVKSQRAGTTAEYSNGTLQINANANSAALAQWKLPPNTGFVAARIWKETDVGMSWGPGLALLWPDGKFVLVNARSPLGQFSIATQSGETLLNSLPPALPEYDLPASSFRLEGMPRIHKTKDRQELIAAFRHPTKPLRVEWRATLRNGSHYLRQQIEVRASGAAGVLSNVEAVDFPVSDVRQIGTVPGSPLAGDGWFFGAELPNGANETSDGARAFVATELPLQMGAEYSFASVAGVYPNGQLRRAFLAYIERERARPSTPFLHYNGWYDFAQGVNAKDLAASISAYHQELTVKRGVPLDSYVIDDGWDDAQNTFWGVDQKKFPAGFAPIAAQLKAIDSHLGLWVSPLGGYGEAAQRTANARKLGLVEEGKALDLSYAPYYRWFLAKHQELMREYQVNYFKWDKAGDGVTPHFLALVRIANELRRADPNVFINVTVGTWPSPFWLNHIDATWRTGSADMFWIGAGDKREQWLNFRDAEAYDRFVKIAPLYPLNSVMHHGIALGKHYQGKEIAVAGADLKHDARSYFATGATLQELYLTPSMMTDAAWDEVAAGAKWSRANFDVLADAHWIGGNPRQGEVYGYASWAPRKGIFMLRNPSDKPSSITLDAATIFELPDGAKRNFTLSTPYADQRIKSGVLRAGTSQSFTLEPFEVLVFEALPQNTSY